jgi:hypothetical protein
VISSIGLIFAAEFRKHTKKVVRITKEYTRAPELKERKMMVTLMIILSVIVAVATYTINGNNNMSLSK